MMLKTSKSRISIRKQVLLLLMVAFFMFSFGYALVPLYDVLCKKLGINGKTSGEATEAPVSAVDMSRTIRVQFIAMNNAKLPWKFYPYKTTVEVNPGKNTRIAYFAKNESGKTMTVQAIPSVSPSVAAKYLKKTECFCFERQTLEEGQTMDMPLLFHIDRDLPKEIQEITLSYTLFDVTDHQKVVSDEKRGKL